MRVFQLTEGSNNFDEGYPDEFMRLSRCAGFLDFYGGCMSMSVNTRSKQVRRFLQLGRRGGDGWQLSSSTSWEVRTARMRSAKWLCRRNNNKISRRKNKRKPCRSERELKVEGVPKLSNAQSGLFLTPNNTKVECHPKGSHKNCIFKSFTKPVFFHHYCTAAQAPVLIQ